MQIRLAHLLVDDQEKALRFYTEKVGFHKAADIHFGSFRWLTVTSPEGAAGVEVALLDARLHAFSRDYLKARFDAGVPALAFTSTDVRAESARLKAAGVVLRGEPVKQGPIVAVLFEDGCGNLINLVQPPA